MFGLFEDIVTIVKAPINIAADITRVVTKPVADVAQAAEEEVKEAVDDITED